MTWSKMSRVCKADE
jgi:hypothetical protein